MTEVLGSREGEQKWEEEELGGRDSKLNAQRHTGFLQSFVLNYLHFNKERKKASKVTETLENRGKQVNKSSQTQQMKVTKPPPSSQRPDWTFWASTAVFIWLKPPSIFIFLLLSVTAQRCSQNCITANLIFAL